MSQSVTGRRVLALVVLMLSLGLLTAQARAQAPADRTVVAYGQASVKPTPKDPKSNASIAAAVKAAAAKAVPLAIADAKQHATELATGAGVTLGELLSISNEPFPQPFYAPFNNEEGTFGRGKYCGRITSFRRVKGKDGKTRLRRRTRRTCRIPQVTRQVELTYAMAD